MPRFDHDVKWDLLDILRQAGGRKSKVMPSEGRAASLWIFWEQRTEVLFTCEDNHQGHRCTMEFWTESGAASTNLPYTIVVYLDNELKYSITGGFYEEDFRWVSNSKQETLVSVENIVKSRLQTEEKK